MTTAGLPPDGTPTSWHRRGLWLGCAVAIGALLLGQAVGLMVFLEAEQHVRPSCASNLKVMLFGLMMYAVDYDDRLPPARVWADGVVPYTLNPNLFTCPSASRNYGGLATHYGFNSLLGERRTEDIPAPADCPMLFESSVLFAPDMSRNVTNPLTSFVARHRGTGHIAYADGHVRAVKTPPDAYAGLLMPDAGEPSE